MGLNSDKKKTLSDPGAAGGVHDKEYSSSFCVSWNENVVLLWNASEAKNGLLRMKDVSSDEKKPIPVGCLIFRMTSYHLVVGGLYHKPLFVGAGFWTNQENVWFMSHFWQPVGLPPLDLVFGWHAIEAIHEVSQTLVQR